MNVDCAMRSAGERPNLAFSAQSTIESFGLYAAAGAEAFGGRPKQTVTKLFL